MLKKITFYFSMLLITGICIYSVIIMNKTDARYEVNLDEEDISNDISEQDLYVVSKGDVSQKLVLNGTISPIYGDEMYEVFVEGKASDIKSYVSLGQIVNKDEVYAEFKNKEYKANNKICCIGIEQNDIGVKYTFLEYSKLYVQIKVPEENITDSINGKTVSVFCNNIKFEGKVTFVDNYCIDGFVSVKVEYKNEEILLRPGSSCVVEMVLDEKTDVIVVPTACVIYDEYSDEYRVMLYDGSASYTKTIEIGIIGDGVVEVISGMSADETIVFPRAEMSLKYYLDYIKN